MVNMGIAFKCKVSVLFFRYHICFSQEINWRFLEVYPWEGYQTSNFYYIVETIIGHSPSNMYV